MSNDLGDNCNQNFHLGGISSTVGNLVLRRRESGGVKRDFRPYIRRNTSPNENVGYGYIHLLDFVNFQEVKFHYCHYPICRKFLQI